MAGGHVLYTIVILCDISDDPFSAPAPGAAC
jgi:hypothetical protein